MKTEYIEYADFVSLVRQMRSAEATWHWSGTDKDKEHLEFWKAEVDRALRVLAAGS
jgi:hypothetical protein